MIKGIIFDFNRTLYIPELQKIPDESMKLLQDLKKSGFLLALISMKEAQRDKLVESYNLFSFIKIVEEKNTKVFGDVLQSFGCLQDEVIVVGDRIKSEIKIANQLGMKTIWYRQGKFSGELPTERFEQPNWVINSLHQVKAIIEEINTNKIRDRKSNTIKS